jgi:hypothetical protein
MSTLRTAVHILAVTALLLVSNECWISTECRADPPDRLYEYHILPRHSLLHQTGGFAGVNEFYRLRGDYDLHVGWDYGTEPPTLDPFARFVDPNITGRDITPSHFDFGEIDVDDLLNLTELEGELLPLGAPFDVYEFTGEGDSGERIRLLGVQRGAWMYVRGQMTAPPGSADFFEYQVRWVARQGQWADYNGDGRVDAADYTVMRDSNSLAAVDMSMWRSQFGEEPDMAMLESMMDTAAGSLAFTAGSVPEPGTCVLLVVSVGVVAFRYRRTRAC